MKSTLRIIFLIAISIAVGYTTTDYVGKTYSKTDSVEIYFNKDEIKCPHEVMGQIKAEAPEALKFEDMEQQLVKDAMEKGADADNQLYGFIIQQNFVVDWVNVKMVDEKAMQLSWLRTPNGGNPE